ncbi:MAG: acyl-CoA dehydrogenase family protein [Burkholderiaceae bacterium]
MNSRPRRITNEEPSPGTVQQRSGHRPLDWPAAAIALRAVGFGGYRDVAGVPVERIWRDLRVTQRYEGTRDVQRLIVGRARASPPCAGRWASLLCTTAPPPQ